ncbi:MAG: hypothetical protein ABJ246_16910 [Paracoccaceae bacterium]
MRNKRLSFGAALLALMSGPVVAQSDTPLSVIDWLDQQVATPATIQSDPVAQTGLTPDVTVTPLDGTTTRVVGLVPSSVTGLPSDLWTGTGTAILVRQLNKMTLPRLPAAQSLLFSLVLGEALPPAGDNGAFDLARIDTLIRMGALEPALALLEIAGPDQSAAHFERYRDLQLISGETEQMCERLIENPNLANDPGLDVYCHARSGDYETAVLLYGTSNALGLYDTQKSNALARFLDPDLFEGKPALPQPQTPDALMFALFDAEGERLTTRSWPRIYAHADLNPRAGWKSQLEAAERLAETGALPENRLLGLYTSRQPAASGGIWDRVRAVQRLDQAVRARSVTAVTKTLPAAWAAARAARIERPIAALFAEPLQNVPITGSVAERAFELMLISPLYENAATAFPTMAQANPVARGLAAGNLQDVSGNGPIEQSLIDAFTRTPADADIMRTARDGALGTALLETLSLLNDGAAGDMARLPVALATLRALGLEDTARQAALQMLLLEGER